MQYVAYILPGVVIYRRGLVLLLAALSGVFLLLTLRARQGKPLFDAAALAALSSALALPCARALHWYCNTGIYSSFRDAMTNYSVGGFTALGVVAAVLLSALILRGLGIIRELPSLLDCAAPAGALALSLGRMSCLFSADDRSKFSLENPALRHFPLMVSSTLPSGGTEWRIATFALESISCAILCAVFLLLFSTLRCRKRYRKAWKDGNVFWLAAAAYGAVTVVLDSTRYDALYLRSNGFVSLTQICCVVAILTPTVIYSVRSVKIHGLSGYYFVIWVLWAAFGGLGGYMEYYVQRHAAEFLKAYAVMEFSFLILFALVCLLCSTTRAGTKKRPPL